MPLVMVMLNVKVTDICCPDTLTVKLNGRQLERGPLTWRFKKPEDWLEFVVDPQNVKQGLNDIEIALGSGEDIHCMLQDIHLRLEHGARAHRRRDMTMSRNRFLAYYDSMT